MGKNNRSTCIKWLRWRLACWYTRVCSWLLKRGQKGVVTHGYVQYRCGHKKWVPLPRSKTEYKQKQAWLLMQLCADCHRHHQRDQRARLTHKDLEEAYLRGLVDLRGSAVMITWALRIRANCLAEIDQRFAQKRSLPDATEELLHSGLSACIRAINRHADASWWIDHMGELPQILTLDYLRELVYESPERRFQNTDIYANISNNARF